MSFLVSGTSDRIFLNTALGCNCRCQYCYLSEEGIRGIQYFSHQQVFDELMNLKCFEPGAKGSVLSIGCYSECFSKENRQETLALIEKIAPLGNRIQLATKRKLNVKDLLRIDEYAVYKNQIGIYVSVPTLSRSSEIETGTDPAYDRLEILSYQHLFQYIYFVLYIKPVLPGITRLDISEYGRILQKYHLRCVIGGLLHPLTDDRTGMTKVGQSWFEETNEEQDELINALRPYTTAYKHSVDIIRQQIKEEEGYCYD